MFISYYNLQFNFVPLLIFRRHGRHITTTIRKWFVNYAIVNADSYIEEESASFSQYTDYALNALNLYKNRDKINFTRPMDLREYVKGKINQ